MIALGLFTKRQISPKFINRSKIMKKLFPVISAFLAIAILAGCKGAPQPVEPPPVEEPTPPPPPPPPPPPTPPPEPEDESDTEGPALSAAISPELFSPNGDGKNDELAITLSAEDESGIWSWMVEIYDPSNSLFYQMSGSGEPPAELTWDGRSNIPGRAGELVQSDSEYGCSFNATDSAGNVSSMPLKILVSDIKGPELAVNFSPELFSPDGDGENDELLVTLGAKDESGILNWKIQIYEPNSTDKLFYAAEGEGEPPVEFPWDGRSNITGELVQSASDYEWVFSAADNEGNVSTLASSLSVISAADKAGNVTIHEPKMPLKVDILVIRDGDRYLVQVPSIVFGANSGGFDGLEPAVVENNNYILTRIAAVLNKFETYKVTVEGHTNPVGQTERERQREQIADQRLSTQRAQTVVNRLVGLGVDRSRLTATGVGGTRPLVPFATPDGKPNRDNWWKNRRVEFLLVK
jgi:hypothetical protein